jgi:ADP-ribose pyrophosphatase
MSPRRPLPPPPRVRIEVVAEERDPAAKPFLRVRRPLLRNHYADGTTSRDYAYDMVERDAIDAVGIVLWAETPDGTIICLRAGLRPPLAFRDRYALPIPDPTPAAMIWEIPAGLVEPDEQGPEGLRACAARETLEEVGLRIDPAAFGALGPAVALSPGVIGEKVHFLEARTDADARGEPTMDGSAVEERGEIRWLLLDDALAATRDGRIADVKTEIAIRRLAERRGPS